MTRMQDSWVLASTCFLAMATSALTTLITYLANLGTAQLTLTAVDVALLLSFFSESVWENMLVRIGDLLQTPGRNWDIRP